MRDELDAGGELLDHGIAELRDALHGNTGGLNDDVTFTVAVDGLHGLGLGVQAVHLQERLNELSSCGIDILCAGPAPDAHELLGKDVKLTISRRSELRCFRGLILSASSAERVEGTVLHVQAVPAAWLLTRRVESRIYSDMSVPAIIKSVIEEHLGPRRRTIDIQLTRDYPELEYVVQYRESCWAFVSRLCEREGIFFYFDHENAEHEVLVLADTSAGRPKARASADSRIAYWADPAQAPDHEAVSEIQHHEEYGINDTLVAGFDWTNPRLDVRGAASGRGSHSPVLELYDHTDVVRHFDYRSGQYGQHDASRQANLRAEAADLDRESWNMATTAVSMQAGYLFELTGAPDPKLDQRYLVVGLSAAGGATEGSAGYWSSSVEVVPTSMPYRPPRRTALPTVLGPETAIVVGRRGNGQEKEEDERRDSNSEIYTDQHGRVKVQFHWDRHGQHDERSSCWIRVAQGWAGPGWGTFFLPRIGMEVIVNFVGGDPDRPIIMGCLYNGQNAPPYALPEHQTRSTIKTNSSTGGDGYNELRFEDKKGSEEIWVHAERDMNVVVENDRTTHVVRDRTDRVDRDHDETVGRNQTNRVVAHRSSTVGRETIAVGGDRRVEVHGKEGLTTHATRTEVIGQEYATTVKEGNRVIRVDDGVYDLHQVKSNHNKLLLDELAATLFSSAMVDCKAAGDIADGPRAQLRLLADGLVELVSWESKTLIAAKTELKLSVGENVSITLTESEVEIQAPTVKVNGANLTDIKGGIVKINCD